MAGSGGIQLQLRQEHDALRRIMQRFAVAMRSDDNTDRPALLHDRVTFAQLFANHSRVEQESISSLSAARLPSSAADAVNEHRAGMLALRRDYSAHVNLWRPDQIAKDNERYAVAVLALQDRLRGYMIMEEDHIFPLLS